MKERTKMNYKGIPELVSGSSTQVVAVGRYKEEKNSYLKTLLVEDPETLKQVQGDSVDSAVPMTTTTARGFTLIELLVVVLIIGILAAVALPQYKKAVVKARFAEAISNLSTIGRADSACQLNKGKPCSMEELDVAVGELGVSNTDIMCATGTESAASKYFDYCASASVGETPIAQYNQEDVCLCYYNGQFFVDDSHNGCGPGDVSLDYKKLLNLPSGIPGEFECYCC